MQHAVVDGLVFSGCETFEPIEIQGRVNSDFQPDIQLKQGTVPLDFIAARGTMDEATNLMENSPIQAFVLEVVCFRGTIKAMGIVATSAQGGS